MKELKGNTSKNVKFSGENKSKIVLFYLLNDQYCWFHEKQIMSF